MRRRLFILCSILSMVLCTVIIVIWVRSYWWADALGYRRESKANGCILHNGFVLGSARGGLEAGIIHAVNIRFPDEFPRGITWHTEVASEYLSLGGNFGPPSESFWKKLGFEIGAGGFENGSGEQLRSEHVAAAIVPCYFLTILASTLPCLWMAGRLKRQRRLRHHLCVECGYDLRASTERCPECGTLISKLTT